MKCIKCDSTSVIKDGEIWVCFQHIEPCRCKQNHDQGSEWTFRTLGFKDGIFMDDMEFQLPEIERAVSYAESKALGTKIRWVNLRSKDSEKVDK